MIREARPCDLAAVVRIAAVGFAKPAEDRMGAAWWVRILARPGTSLLVDSPGVDCVRGFVLVESYPTGRVCRLIATDPTYRRQGVGRRLLATIDAPASAWVRAENTGSRGLFAASGWRQVIDPPARRRAGSWVYFTRG